MPDPLKTVFISYRRSISSFIARAIFLDLRARRYDVFMDVESIDAGTFDTIILNQIAARAHFLIICTPGTFERCESPDDWLRREIEAAMDHQRNIVPIATNGFKFEDDKRFLSGRLEELARLNALPLFHEYFDEGMARLRHRYLRHPVAGAILPVPKDDQPIVEQKLEQIIEQAAPTTEELTAEEYFHRALGRTSSDLLGQVADYSEAIELNPTYFWAYNNRGISNAELGHLEEAIYDFDQAIFLDPTNAKIYSNRGNTRRKQGDLDGAIIDFDQAIHFDPNSATAYYNRGVTCDQKGDSQGAIEDYDRAISIDPEMVEAYYNRGIARLQKGDIDGAIADYSEAIRLAPDYSDAYTNRGLARAEQDDINGAIADYSEAIRIDPTYAKAYNNRGYAYSRSGNFDSALQDFTTAIQLDPKYTSAYGNRGFVRYQKGDLELALGDMTIAQSLDYPAGDRHYYWGQIKFTLGHYIDAYGDFEEALKLAPDMNSANAGLAISLQTLGRVDEAQSRWRDLIAADLHYLDVDWIAKELRWRPELIEAARRLIASLDA